MNTLGNRLGKVDVNSLNISFPFLLCGIHQGTCVSSNMEFFGIEILARSGLATAILKIFVDNQAEILVANVSVNDGNLILAITALVQNGNGD